jgi:hypothetical protein
VVVLLGSVVLWFAAIGFLVWARQGFWEAYFLAVATLYVAGAPVMFLAIGLVRRSRRYTESASRVLARDPRAPVLYLRSFDADERAAKVDIGESAKLAVMWPFAITQFIRELRGDTEEEYWTTALTKIGPPVAIGTPGKRPFRGAARIYVSDDRWQETVRELAAEAALVVILGGVTQGLQGEVTYVTHSLPRSKVIFLLPNDPDAFAAFAATIRGAGGIDVGDHPKVAHRRMVCAVLRVRNDSRPEILPVWGASRESVGIALRPVIASHTGALVSHAVS